MASLVFLIGPLIGLVLGFVAVVLFVQLLASMTPDTTGATRVLGGIFWASSAAGGGFISIFLGLLFCLLEVAARAKAFSTAFRRDAWEQFIRRGRFLRRVTRILAVGRQHSLQHHHRRDH